MLTTPHRLLTMAAALTFAPLLASQTAGGANVTAQPNPQGVAIEIDGEPFTQYLVLSGAKPILWPILGPTGQPMTRSYPMVSQPVEGEKQDHRHHRSLWFTHGSVNGVDFWGEGSAHGTIVHQRFTDIRSGPVAQLVSHNNWVGPDGKKICQDQRHLRFGAEPDCRWIDFDITLRATDGDVTFGDTKEGSFGIRVAGTMKVDSGQGRIVNSQGQEDKQAWGKTASWVDYQGPVAGELLGIAVLNHPTSFRYPTYWHVRTYGLFAANPFGLHDFLGQSKPIGSYTLRDGSEIRLRYRVLLHRGDEKRGRVAERFVEYCQSP